MSLPLLALSLPHRLGALLLLLSLPRLLGPLLLLLSLPHRLGLSLLPLRLTGRLGPLLLLFSRAPFGLGFPPASLFLAALLGFDLLLFPALFRRYPRFAQCRDDLVAEAFNCLADSGRTNIEMTEWAPIDVLTCADDR